MTWEIVAELIVEWLVPAALGACVGFISSMLLRMKAIKLGLQCLLRAEIIRSHDKYTDRKYCPIYAKEALTRAYKAYHTLGGNDVATELYKDTMGLPEEKKGVCKDGDD